MKKYSNRRGDTTTLTPASTKGKSLRTTVPASIVRQLSLREGDKLRWKLEAKDNKLIVVVQCVKKEG